jgi:hypothetical protein
MGGEGPQAVAEHLHRLLVSASHHQRIASPTCVVSPAAFREFTRSLFSGAHVVGTMPAGLPSQITGNSLHFLRG